MIPETSAVVRKLSQEEIDFLTQEITNNHGLWMKHPLAKCALLDGQSIILNWVTKINGGYQLQWTFKDKFPKTWELLEQVAEGKAIAKVYWHWLAPGTVALPHSDIRNSYILDGNCYKRYNIYLSIKDGVRLMFDDSDIPVPNAPIENTLFDISTIKVHSVYNDSPDDLYIMVVDVLNPGIAIHDDMFSRHYADVVVPTRSIRLN